MSKEDVTIERWIWMWQEDPILNPQPGARWAINFCLALFEPEEGDLRVPQYVRFGYGPLLARIGKVVPVTELGTKVLSLLILIFALVTSLSAHVPGILVRWKRPTRERPALGTVLRFWLTLYSAYAIYFSLVAIVVLTYVFTSGAADSPLKLLLLPLPLSFVVFAFRSTLDGYRTLYRIRGSGRLISAIILSVLCSYVTAPLVFLPLLYLGVTLYSFWNMFA